MTTAEHGTRSGSVESTYGSGSHLQTLVEAGSNEVFNFNLIDPTKRNHIRT